ncbi:hypothetical protein F2Q70_00037598 [Brassica cretica]|uniref:Uncharacterized protein n=1 Tax=Brassica cretica TaxID=69181 RepID=A0A8S9JZP3_BRACR|nr:hypothetical protein F2Q68_00033062 [Brassica cretica]KAF2587575.1 hypothetical protein F2Q70_00037598 [Brassica cretica]
MYTMADAAAIWQSTGAANPFFLSKEPVLDFAGTLVVDFLGLCWSSFREYYPWKRF